MAEDGLKRAAHLAQQSLLECSHITQFAVHLPPSIGFVVVPSAHVDANCCSSFFVVASEETFSRQTISSVVVRLGCECAGTSMGEIFALVTLQSLEYNFS